MQPFILEATDRTLRIEIVPEEGRIALSGESFPEDAATFYGPVIDAASTMVAQAKTLAVEFSLIYVNSSSMKALYRLFEVIDERRASGQCATEVLWTHEPDDDVMQELGEDFKDRFPELSFKILATE